MNQGMIFAFASFIMWGFWAFLPKLALKHIQPYSLLVYEILGMAVATGLLWAVMRFKVEVQPMGVAFALLTGISGSVAMMFYLFALTKEKTAPVVMISALYPLVTLLLAFALLKEPLTVQQGIGIVLGLVAMVFLAG